MSPSEDDLRTALSDGAGDTPDADTIVLTAGRQRAQRQKRVLSAAAAVIVVGGVATGASLLAHHGDHHPAADAQGGRALPAAHSATSSATAAGAGGTVSDGTNAVGCPSQPASQVGGTNTAGSSTAGPLFAKPVASAVVCAYPMAATGDPTTIRLTGTDATTLTDSLENAGTTRPREMCPDYRLDTQRTIVVLARATDGTQLAAVTTTVNEPSCDVVVSNGSTTRYDWAPPTALRPAFSRLVPAALSGSTSPSSSIVAPSGGANGSPVH